MGGLRAARRQHCKRSLLAVGMGYATPSVGNEVLIAAVGVRERARCDAAPSKPPPDKTMSRIAVTGLRIAGVGAHHSTTAAATTANTPYAIAGSRR